MSIRFLGFIGSAVFVFFCTLLAAQSVSAAGSYVNLKVTNGSASAEGVTGTPTAKDMVKAEVGDTILVHWDSNIYYNPFDPQGGGCKSESYFGQNMGNPFYIQSTSTSLDIQPAGNVWVTLLGPGYFFVRFYCSDNIIGLTEKKTVTIAVSPKGTNGCVPTYTCWKNVCGPATCSECGIVMNGCSCVNGVCPAAVGGGSGSGGSSGGAAVPPKVKPPTTDPTLITSFTIDQASLSAPGPITLTWAASAAATSCTSSGGWSDPVTPIASGTLTKTVTHSTVFYLECFNAAGLSSGERSVQVLVSTPNCTPNTACAQDLCSGTTCPDGCGGDINGQQNCTIPDCVPNDACADDKCTFDTCFNNCGTEIQGKKQCAASSANTTCTTGTCKGSCDLTKEKIVSVCNNNTGKCCEPLVPTTTIVSTTPWSNPVAFNTVEGLLDSILGFLQASIVILSLIMIVIGSLVYMTAGGEEGKLKTGKYIITASLVGLALALAAPTFLKEVGNILGWNGVNNAAANQAKTITEILTTALNFLLSIVGIIAIIMLIIGGLMYLTSAGDEERMNKGKSIVVYSLIGITVALSALVLVTMVVGWFV